MKFEELLDQNSILAINEKTRISVANIDKLAKKDFSDLRKVQVLGFISILEREYGESFDDLRQAANEYFGSSAETIHLSEHFIKDVSSSNGNKRIILFLGIILIAVVWFFYSSILENNKQSIITPIVDDINNTIVVTKKENNITDINQTKEANTTSQKSSEANLSSAVASGIKIVPLKKMWFAVVDLATKKVFDHIISEPFDANSTSETLIVTSVAPFSMVTKIGEKKYNDFKSHYFKVTAGTPEEITKELFLSNGGPKNLTR